MDNTSQVIKMENLIGIKFKNKFYTDVDDSSIKQAKIVGLYFSSSSSPPCKLFLRELCEFYKEVNLDGHKFEIINIPFDNSEADLKEYIKNLPWLTIPYSDNLRITTLKNKFKVESIPSVIVLNFQGDLVTSEGRKLISTKGEAVFYDNFIKNLPKVEEEKSKENEQNEEITQSKIIINLVD